MNLKITCPGDNGTCRHMPCVLRDWWRKTEKRLIKELKKETESCLGGRLPEIEFIGMDCKLTIYPEKAKQENMF